MRFSNDRLEVCLTNAEFTPWATLYDYNKTILFSFISFLTSSLSLVPPFACIFVDEFILDAVVNTGEILSDSDAASVTHARPFGESSFSAVVSSSRTTVGIQNLYIAVGTFVSAIFIVTIVVSIRGGCFFLTSLLFYSLLFVVDFFSLLLS